MKNPIKSIFGNIFNGRDKYYKLETLYDYSNHIKDEENVKNDIHDDYDFGDKRYSNINKRFYYPRNVLCEKLRDCSTYKDVQLLVSRLLDNDLGIEATPELRVFLECIIDFFVQRINPSERTPENLYKFISLAADTEFFFEEENDELFYNDYTIDSYGAYMWETFAELTDDISSRKHIGGLAKCLLIDSIDFDEIHIRSKEKLKNSAPFEIPSLICVLSGGKENLICICHYIEIKNGEETIFETPVVIYPTSIEEDCTDIIVYAENFSDNVRTTLGRDNEDNRTCVFTGAECIIEVSGQVKSGVFSANVKVSPVSLSEDIEVIDNIYFENTKIGKRKKSMKQALDATDITSNFEGYGHLRLEAAYREISLFPVFPRRTDKKRKPGFMYIICTNNSSVFQCGYKEESNDIKTEDYLKVNTVFIKHIGNSKIKRNFTLGIQCLQSYGSITVGLFNMAAVAEAVKSFNKCCRINDAAFGHENAIDSLKNEKDEIVFKSPAKECHMVDTPIKKDEEFSRKATIKRLKSLYAGNEKDFNDMAVQSKPIYADPIAIKEFLDKTVVGQEEAKISLSMALANHMKAYENRYNPDFIRTSETTMIIGPSGSGKTLIARKLSEYSGLPVSIADASQLTADGWHGLNKSDVLKKLYKSTDSQEKAEYGILVLDEFDKMCRNTKNHYGGLGSYARKDQESMLGLLDGIPIQNVNHNDECCGETYKTKNLLIILTGAFSEMKSVEDEKKQPIGFGKTDNRNEKEISDRLIEYGILPELVGRLSNITSTSKLTDDQIVEAITETDESVIAQYRSLVNAYGKKFYFSKEYVKEIIAKSPEELGVRGVRNIINKELRKKLYEAIKNNSDNVYLGKNAETPRVTAFEDDDCIVEEYIDFPPIVSSENTRVTEYDYLEN